MDITIAYISRNRPGHLQKSLESMMSQTVLPSKIIISDCSDVEYKSEINKLVELMNEKRLVHIELLWTNPSGFSRSKSRNLGCCRANTEIVVSTECDIVYDSKLIEMALKSFSEHQNIYIQTYIRLQNQDLSFGKVRQHHRSGFFQAFRKESFNKLGGYNPFLYNWGFEDADFRTRIINSGCTEVVLPFLSTHLWHVSSVNNEHNKQNQIVCSSSYWDGNMWNYNGQKESCCE